MKDLGVREKVRGKWGGACEDEKVRGKGAKV